jgi:cellulose biosynthesis protein BcsQ
MGKIITFYSYKGGVGRSMALANVAWVLASAGKRVLVVDWDLEAPGLHRYFRPFLVDKDLDATDGLIDFFHEYARVASTPVESDEPAPQDWYKSYANILRYAVSLDWEFPGRGSLDYVSAGRQTSDYASRVSGFNWTSFYERIGGATFLEAVKEKMRSEYDYVLIDSRTGVSDIAGICTIQMPDAVVMCFTLNWQSIEGAAHVAQSLASQRSGERSSPLQIFPVPMRVEFAERNMLDKARLAARERFNSFPGGMMTDERQKYWNQVEVPYMPFYAYNEILPAFGDQPFVPHSILASAERLTAYLTDGDVTQASPIPEATRLQILEKYSR